MPLAIGEDAQFENLTPELLDVGIGVFASNTKQMRNPLSQDAVMTPLIETLACKTL